MIHAVKVTSTTFFAFEFAQARPLPIFPTTHGDSFAGAGSLTMTFALAFTFNFPCFTPRKVVEMPESVDGKDEIPNREGQKVYQHPKHVDDLAGGDEDEDCWETEDSDEEHEGDGLFEVLGRCDGHADDERIGEGNSDWEDDSAEKIHEDDKLHTEAECAAKVPDEDEFHQVVNGRIDPSATLGKEDLERVRDDCSAASLRKEHHLAVREGSDEDGG